MSAYKQNITVDIHDVDYNGVAKTSSILRYLPQIILSPYTDSISINIFHTAPFFYFYRKFNIYITST